MYHVLHEREFVDARENLIKQWFDAHVPPRDSMALHSKSTDIHLFHYSGSIKPWHRLLDATYSSDLGPAGDARFVRDTLESFNGWWLWALKDPDTVKGKGSVDGVALGADGNLYWID